MTLKSVRAYAVHLFTALSAGFGIWSLIAIHQQQLQLALILLGITVLIDSIDGTLARYWHIDAHGAAIDGALLDNIVDYLTWTIAPLFWGYQAIGLPVWILTVAAVASALGFANKRAKTEDHFFLGFPSYWNLILFFAWLLEIGPEATTGLLLLCSILVFVPFKYVYPSRTKPFQPLTLSLGAIFVIQLVALILLFDQSPDWLIYSGLLFPTYYIILSAYLNVSDT